LASATKNPVWFVLGVQSSARRTFWGSATGTDPDVDGDADAAPGLVVSWLPEQPTASAAATMTIVNFVRVCT
jgi:hypothetical protein